MKAATSASQEDVSRLIADADRPAAVPKCSARAGTKSLVDSPCRYSSGRTSVTAGERRAYGGRVGLAKRVRSPLSSAPPPAFTPGAENRAAPAPRTTALSQA